MNSGTRTGAGRTAKKPNVPSEKAAKKDPVWNEDTNQLLKDWHKRAAAARDAHYILATRLRRRNVLLGVPVVVLTSVVGTSVFATLNDESIATDVRVIVGLISVLAAVLSGIQTFLRFSERAEKHVIAADWYAAIRREVAEILALPYESRDNAKHSLDQLRKELNKIGPQSPEIGTLWEDIAARYGIDDANPVSIDEQGGLTNRKRL